MKFENKWSLTKSKIIIFILKEEFNNVMQRYLIEWKNQWIIIVWISVHIIDFSTNLLIATISQNNKFADELLCNLHSNFIVISQLYP